MKEEIINNTVTSLLNRQPIHDIPIGEEHLHTKSKLCICKPYAKDIWGMKIVHKTISQK